MQDYLRTPNLFDPYIPFSSTSRPRYAKPKPIRPIKPPPIAPGTTPLEPTVARTSPWMAGLASLSSVSPAAFQSAGDIREPWKQYSQYYGPAKQSITQEADIAKERGVSRIGDITSARGTSASPLAQRQEERLIEDISRVESKNKAQLEAERSRMREAYKQRKRQLAAERVKSALSFAFNFASLLKWI